MNLPSVWKSAVVIVLALAGAAYAQRPGDEWVTVRGDASPGLRYSVATTTTSGRIIAVGQHGSLMISDDSGANWRYEAIRVDGLPLHGTITTVYQVPGGNLMAVLVRLEEADEGIFRYQARSYFLTSTNNGTTWSMAPFPETSAAFRGTGRRFHGVHIMGLHMGPGNQLLAYGTISGSNNPVVVWSLGGLIFRQTSAGRWEQALFEYGPVEKITNAGGRAVAAAYSAILDSADGAGWNGYTMDVANVSLDGELMDYEQLARLRVLDVEVLNNGTYVAQGARFAPFGGLPNVDTSFLLESYKMSSPTPFSGARNWTAYPERYHGPFTKVGNTILSAGPGGTWATSHGEAGFTLTGPDVRAYANTIAVSGSTTAVAVESSETVWKSTNAGESWVKVWDREIGPDLEPLGYFHGRILAAPIDNSDALWFSSDNGVTWEKAETTFEGNSSIVTDGNGRLFAAAGESIVTSEDGLNWTTKPIGTDRGGYLLTRTPTGRLIMPVRGWDAWKEGKFYVSDDNGDTWETRNAGLAFGEVVRAVVVARNGRILVATNTFASFNPSIVYSDDNGDSWKRSDALQTLEGLDTVTGDPTTRITEILHIRLSNTGRLVAMDENVLFTSDDHGDTWTVRENLDFNGTGSYHLLRLADLIQIRSRWIGIGHYALDYPLRGNKRFLLISDDDGATWGMRPFETRQTNTFLYALAEGANGRLLIGGGNGAIFVSDSEAPADPNGAALEVREGKTEQVPISRPGVDGAVTVNYTTLGSTAVPEVDFVPVAGTLHWAADDLADKFIPLEMPDNSKVDVERELMLQLAFATDGGLVGRIETPVTIIDNDRLNSPGLILDGASRLYTSETGDSATLGIALQSRPSSNVVVTIEGLDASEGRLSSDSFTFTPDNWGVMQTLTVTGVDDDDPDGDVTYNLAFLLASDDNNYATLARVGTAVINVGDEPLPPLFPPDPPSGGSPLSIVVTDDNRVILTATGIDPDSAWIVESSADLRTFGDRREATGAELLAGVSLPKTGAVRYYRVRPDDR